MTDFIEIRDTRTAYELTGSGPPLLMLHGGEGSRRSFAKILPELSDRFTVITYDQRDCGETVGPESPANLATLADDACALVQALGHARAFVFGTSFGGRVAQALALRHAQVVSRLVLASTWPLPVSLAHANADVASETARLRAQLPASAEQLADYFFPARFLADHPEYKRHFKAAPVRSARSERRAATVGDTPELAIGGIGMPILLVAGGDDRLVPAELTLSLARYIHGTRSVVLPGVGHLSYVQAPAVLAPHLRDFLT